MVNLPTRVEKKTHSPDFRSACQEVFLGGSLVDSCRAPCDYHSGQTPSVLWLAKQAWRRFLFLLCIGESALDYDCEPAVNFWQPRGGREFRALKRGEPFFFKFRAPDKAIGIEPPGGEITLGGEHRVNNGLLLRRDLHRLYDRGYVTITPDYVFLVGESLREEFKNGRSYYGLSDSRIALPTHEVWQPSKELLAWHREEIFRG